MWILFVRIFTSRFCHSSSLLDVTYRFIPRLAKIVPVWAKFCPNERVFHFFFLHLLLLDLSRLLSRNWQLCIYVTHPFRSFLFVVDWRELCALGSLSMDFLWHGFFLWYISPLLHTDWVTELINFLKPNIDPFDLLFSLWIKLQVKLIELFVSIKYFLLIVDIFWWLVLIRWELNSWARFFPYDLF